MIVHDWLLPYSEGELGERAQAPSTVHGPMTVKDGGGGGGGEGGVGEGDEGGEGGEGGGESSGGVGEGFGDGCGDGEGSSIDIAWRLALLLVTRRRHLWRHVGHIGRQTRAH